MRILITGINGFVGKILSQVLEQDGYDVYGIDLHGNNKNIFNVDITDLSAIEKCLKEISPDFIYHLAAISKVDFKKLSTLYNINVNGTMNLLTASVNLEKLPKFLLVSSSQVYGIVDDSLQQISEEALVNPVNHYGACKAASENIAKVFHLEYDLPLVIARPFNHIGRGQNAHFVVPKIIQAFKDRDKEIELGNLDVIREFLDVRDVVEIYKRLMENFHNGKVFNLCRGEGYSILEIIKILEDITGYKLNIKNSNSLLRKNEILKSIGDCSLISATYNWHPEFKIKDSLEWILSDN